MSVPPKPQRLRNGQWRSDHAVVTGFIIETFRAHAVARDDRILDLERIYDGFLQPTDLATRTSDMVVGSSVRNIVETVRRAAENQVLCPGPSAEVLDPTVFPVELPEAAYYPLRDGAQRLLSDSLPLIRLIIGNARSAIQGYMAQSLLSQFPPADGVPAYLIDSTILALVVGFEMLEAGWPVLPVGCAIALLGLRLDGNQYWIDTEVFRKVWDTLVPELRTGFVTGLTMQMTKTRRDSCAVASYQGTPDHTSPSGGQGLVELGGPSPLPSEALSTVSEAQGIAPIDASEGPRHGERTQPHAVPIPTVTGHAGPALLDLFVDTGCLAVRVLFATENLVFGGMRDEQALLDLPGGLAMTGEDPWEAGFSTVHDDVMVGFPVGKEWLEKWVHTAHYTSFQVQGDQGTRCRARSGRVFIIYLPYSAIIAPRQDQWHQAGWFLATTFIDSLVRNGSRDPYGLALGSAIELSLIHI